MTGKEQEGQNLRPLGIDWKTEADLVVFWSQIIWDEVCRQYFGLPLSAEARRMHSDLFGQAVEAGEVQPQTGLRWRMIAGLKYPTAKEFYTLFLSEEDGRKTGEPWSIEAVYCRHSWERAGWWGRRKKKEEKVLTLKLAPEVELISMPLIAGEVAIREYRRRIYGLFGESISEEAGGFELPTGEAWDLVYRPMSREAVQSDRALMSSMVLLLRDGEEVTSRGEGKSLELADYYQRIIDNQRQNRRRIGRK